MTFGIIFKRRDGAEFIQEQHPDDLNMPYGHGWTWWGNAYDRGMSLATAQNYVDSYRGNPFLYQIVRTS